MISIDTECHHINITVMIKWLLLILVLYAYMIVALYYFNSYLSTDQLPPLTMANTLRNEQVFNTALHQAVRETKNTTGYALASDFYQQQTAAAINLFNLQTWAASLSPRMRVIEPFAAASELIMPSDLSPPSLQAKLRFSDYFDINYWNQRSGLDALVSWEQFTASKPHQMIVVIIVHKTSGRVVWENEELAENKECYTRLRQFNNTYNYSVQHQLNVTVIRRVCFTFGFTINESLSIKEFNHYIFKQWIPSQVIVWFTCWPGIRRNRISITDSYYQMSDKPYAMIRTSDRVNDDSMKYTLSHLQPNYTAISIRTVKRWMTLRKKHEQNHIRDYFSNCIKKLGGILDNIQSSQHIYGRPFLAIDLGSYGDMSAEKVVGKETIKQLLEEAVNTVYQNNTSVEEWEESFLTSIEGTRDKGYVAAVQATIAENANCMVMVGGFSRFQYKIMMNYLRKHQNTSCIHRVCYH